MRTRIVALLLSGALLAGAQGAVATAGGATVVWQNPKLTVTRRSQPLTITYKNRIARTIWFRCRFLADSDWQNCTWQAQAAGEGDHPAARHDECQSVLVSDRTRGLANR
jgi:hypothetical protein